MWCTTSLMVRSSLAALTLDSPVRSELETRLTHLQPAELILPNGRLSRTTEKVLRHITDTSRSAAAVRVERVDVPEYSEAFDSLTEFYRQKSTGKGKGKEKEPIDLTAEEGGDVPMHEDGEGEEGDDDDPIGLARGLPRELVAPIPKLTAGEEAVLALVDFPKQVVVALAMCVRYMKGESPLSRALTPDFGLQNAFRNRSSFTKVSCSREV